MWFLPQQNGWETTPHPPGTCQNPSVKSSELPISKRYTKGIQGKTGRPKPGLVTEHLPSQKIPWMKEIRHQFVDGLSHRNPIIYSFLWFPIVTHWCRISSIHSMFPMYSSILAKAIPFLQPRPSSGPSSVANHDEGGRASYAQCPGLQFDSHETQHFWWKDRDPPVSSNMAGKFPANGGFVFPWPSHTWG